MLVSHGTICGYVDFNNSMTSEKKRCPAKSKSKFINFGVLIEKLYPR